MINNIHLLVNFFFFFFFLTPCILEILRNDNSDLAMISVEAIIYKWGDRVGKQRGETGDVGLYFYGRIYLRVFI